MKFTLNNFYSNNYKDFIHLEALKNILRKVPQLKLTGVENIDNILSMEFSVDDWGENPMYITYIDTDGKKHIVKIRPSVSEQIYEILKAYAKISYVDEQDKKLKDELHTEITQGDENTLNLSKTYADSIVNNAKDEINHTIETTKQDLKNYCDNKCEITLASSKEYTDTKHQEAISAVEAGNAETLEASKNYTDTQLAGYETKADAKAEHEKLSAEAESTNKVYGYDITADAWNKCSGSFTVSYDNSSITKLGYCQNDGDVEKGIDFTKLATKQDLNTLNGDVNSMVSWKTTVTDELTRMNGSVVKIPKEEFTPLNGLATDPNTTFGQIFRFNNFAIIRLTVYVANITMASWTFKEAVSFPKSYLNGFSKFTALSAKRQSADGNLIYDTTFDIDKCSLGFYARGNEINNAGIELSISGMLYN